ncbi:uncharacterized protein SAMN02910289_00165 [Lachnospiraceae bacterium RM5]|nr:uncharacterized protein SAMN02910289_00165 [Lachnospiraceae bacterium RM5]
MIHRYKNNGYNIVLDVESGLVHVVDDIMYDVIGAYDEKKEKTDITEDLKNKYDIGEINEAIKEVDELIENESLFTKDVYRDKIDFKKRQTVVKALCLHISHDCNLACKYCFAEEGEYHGRRALMSLEVGKKALDFLIENSGNRKNLEVDFFGGEPLMNWEVVKELVKYGRSREKECNKNFRFTLTTNGVLVDDDVIEFANKEMSNVVMSLDGRKEVNDKMRPTRNGKGSYDIIVPKFKEFAKRRGDKDYYVRGTFTHENLDFASDVLHYADLGFKNMSMEPVVSEPTDSYSIKEEDLPMIMSEYDRLAKEYIKRKKEGNGFTFFHFMIDLDGGPCVYKRLSGCGSGTEYMAVTPWGDLYPCHQFVGDEKFLLGNVFDGVKNTEICDEFKLCNVYAKEKCQKCFAKYYCSGGCAANSYKFHGNINDAYDIGCEMQRKRIECAIMIKAALSEE